MSFNILSQALVDTTVIHLVGPDGVALYADEAQTLPLTIEIYGRTSKQYKNWLERQLKKNKPTRAGKEKEKSLDEVAEDNAEFLSALTIKVSNFDYDGEAIVGKDMFKKLYSNPHLSWINEQVTDTLSDNGNFLQK